MDSLLHFRKKSKVSKVEVPSASSGKSKESTTSLNEPSISAAKEPLKGRGKRNDASADGKKPYSKEKIIKSSRKKNKPTKRIPESAHYSESDVLKAIHVGDLATIVRAYTLRCLPVNFSDENKNNLFHHAAVLASEDVVKALLIFIPDSEKLVRAANGNNDTPVDLAEDKSIRKLFRQFLEYKRPGDEMEVELEGNCYQDLNTIILNKKKGKITGNSKVMVSLDGGGIRGLCSVQIMLALEKKMKTKPFWQHVDWTGGTSTGGIITLLLSLENDLEECRIAYLTLKDKVFIGKKPYETAKLEFFLKQYMTDRKMSSISRPKIALCTVKMKDKNMRLKLIRNYHLDSSSSTVNDGDLFDYDDGHNWDIWKAARCTSAAPYYFQPFGNYLDGALISNNPSLDLITEYFRYSQIKALELEQKNTASDEVAVFISIGTGAKMTQDEELCPEIMDNLKTKEAKGLVRYTELKNIVSTYLRQLMVSDGLPVERTNIWCHSIGTPFFRFTPNLSKDVSISENSNSVVINMMWETEMYIRHIIPHQLTELAIYLDYVFENKKIQSN